MSEAIQEDVEETTPSDAEETIEDRLEGLLNHDTEEAKAESEQTEDIPEEDAVEEISLDASQLAEMFKMKNEDVSIDDDGDISFSTNIDGERGKAKLNELLKSYQLEGHVNKKSMQLAEQQKAFQANQQQLQQQVQTQLQQTETMLQAAENHLVGQYNQIDWNALRQSDPAEFAALQQDYSVRNHEIQQLKQQAVATAQNRQQEVNQRAEMQRRQHLSLEQDALLKAIPEWRDPEVARQGQLEIIEYMKANNWTPQMVEGVNTSHVAMLEVRKLARLERNNIEDKKVGKKPSAVLKPGAANTKAKAGKKANADARKRLRKSGSVDDLTALLTDRI